jgi:pantoate--beta-alanine ligase
VRELQRWSDAERCAGRRIALIPTMGALHEGHLSLVRIGLQHADRVVASIFVNPTQFGPGEDFDAYPRQVEADVAKLARVGVDAVFLPSVGEMYPEGNATWVDVEGITDGLCGASRPGHFRGVATIVSRLFHAAKPHVAVFGEKDFQQLAVIRRMTRDLLFDIEIVPGPTVREPDGLAMSSRNQNLSPEAREQAVCLNAALREARELVRAGVRDAAKLVAAARGRIQREPLARIDYVEVVDADSLAAVDRVDDRALMAVAVRFGTTRLIDNTILQGESQ